MFTKILGICLLISSTLMFIVMPIFTETMGLIKMRRFLSFNVRAVTTLSVMSLLFIWLVFPFPHSKTYTATTFSVSHQVVYVPAAGQIEEIFVEKGSEVLTGDLLATSTSPELIAAIREKSLDKTILEKQIHIAEQSEELRDILPQKWEELIAIKAELQRLNEHKAKSNIKAAVSGTVYDWAELSAGEHIAEGNILGEIANFYDIKAVCFVPEEDHSLVNIGDKVIFRKDNYPDITGKISSISEISTEYLQYPQLGVPFSGELPVIQKEDNKLAMIDSYFAVEINLDTPSRAYIGDTGTVIVRGIWHSHLVSFFKKVKMVLLRESAF